MKRGCGIGRKPLYRTAFWMRMGNSRRNWTNPYRLERAGGFAPAKHLLGTQCFWSRPLWYSSSHLSYRKMARCPIQRMRTLALCERRPSIAWNLCRDEHVEVLCLPVRRSRRKIWRRVQFILDFSNNMGTRSGRTLWNWPANLFPFVRPLTWHRNYAKLNQTIIIMCTWPFNQSRYVINYNYYLCVRWQ